MSREGYLGLGSNVGDRRANLQAAVDALLDACKAVERELGRVGGGPRHGPRAIDVDLLLLGDETYRSERLSLPHEQVTSRRFVLEPLLELAPGLVVPGAGAAVDALAALRDEAAVRRAGPALAVS